MRVFFFVNDTDVRQFDVVELVDTLQAPCYFHVIFEFDNYFFADQRLEKRIKKLLKSSEK